MKKQTERNYYQLLVHPQNYPVDIENNKTEFRDRFCINAMLSQSDMVPASQYWYALHEECKCCGDPIVNGYIGWIKTQRNDTADNQLIILTGDADFDSNDKNKIGSYGHLVPEEKYKHNQKLMDYLDSLLTGEVKLAGAKE